MTNIPKSTSGLSASAVARRAALETGKILKERFYERKTITQKGPRDIVTDVDKKAQELIYATLNEEYPEMGFLGEESKGDIPDKGYVWIVDPVDGTRNYATQIPVVSLVIGLALDGEVLVGVNYDPLLQEMFHAEKGKGAFLNETPIHVSQKTSFSECILGFDLSYAHEGTLHALDVVKATWPNIQTARIMGSSALGLSYAAAGRYDLYFHGGLSPWDQVAGMLLVEEAGGIITDRTGKRADLFSDGIVASNPVLHSEFMSKTEGMAWRTPTRRSAAST